MRSILINPINETIKEVWYDKNKELSRLEWIKDNLSVRTISGIRLDDNGNYLYVDDEGMLLNMNYFFRYTNNDFYVEPVLLAGKGLVVSTDEEGNDIESELTIGDLKPKIEFLGRKALH
tara:strand:+ start:693 stop:1049 length:357 start_codon:yes stop_codon:yes gene_type:complete